MGQPINRGKLMPVDPDRFISQFIEFSKKSMEWCSQESEQEVTLIHKVLTNIIYDAKRRSFLPEETIKAVQSIEEKIEKGDATAEDARISIKQLLDQLQKEYKEFTDPIIMALQFQDRFRQNLENIGKMLEIWHRTRGQSFGAHYTTKEKLIIFGEQLAASATSPEEREVVGKHIEGVKIEKRSTDAIMF